MKLDQLYYLTEAIKYQSISIAADNNFISQPSFSSAITKLEQELGVKLLRRSSKGVTPTESGRVVLETAEQIFKMKGLKIMEGSRAQGFKINNEKLRALQQESYTESHEGCVLLDYFGHSSVRITSPKGITVLLDPWRNDEAWGWWFPETFPEVEVDIALSTHAHFDHDALHIPQALITMERMIGTYTIGDVKITGLADKHMSESVGKTRWTEIQGDTGEDFSPPDNFLHMDNIIYVVETGGVTVVHWGDNRPLPDTFVDEYLKKLEIDVLLLPVDESEHILSYKQADDMMKKYSPGVTIPIHYYLKGVNTVLSTLQPCTPWINTHEEIKEIPGSRLEIKHNQFSKTGKAVGQFSTYTKV